MSKVYAQGDILIEEVAPTQINGTVIPNDPDGATVLGRGEVTGHRHAFYNGVALFRDDALARDIPGGLYIGHFKLDAPADLKHEEHATINLPAGTYRARRQREMDPLEARIVAD